MKQGKFSTRRAKKLDLASIIPQEPFVTRDPREAQRYIAKAQFLKLITPEQVKAIFFLRSKGLGVKFDFREDKPGFLCRGIIDEFLPAGALEAEAQRIGMTRAVLRPIRFMPSFFDDLRNGSKTETRRLSESWSKLQAGDVLRILSSSPDAPTELFRVLEVTREPLQRISVSACIREGIHGYGIKTLEAFRELWDGIHGDTASACWDSNPDVYAIRFAENGKALREVFV